MVTSSLTPGQKAYHEKFQAEGSITKMDTIVKRHFVRFLLMADRLFDMIILEDVYRFVVGTKCILLVHTEEYRDPSICWFPSWLFNHVSDWDLSANLRTVFRKTRWWTTGVDGEMYRQMMTTYMSIDNHFVR